MSFDLNSYIRDVVDFPKSGIVFKDISPLLNSPKALSHSIISFQNKWKGKIDAVVALDARGFIFGSILAFAMQLPLVMIRKKGKLPGETFDLSYSLEYGEASFSIQKDAILPGSRVLIIDDLLATGGSANAACLLAEKAGAQVVGCAFVIELEGLGGRDVLKGRNIHSLLKYS